MIIERKLLSVYKTMDVEQYSCIELYNSMEQLEDISFVEQVMLTHDLLIKRYIEDVIHHEFSVRSEALKLVDIRPFKYVALCRNAELSPHDRHLTLESQERWRFINWAVDFIETGLETDDKFLKNNL